MARWPQLLLTGVQGQSDNSDTAAETGTKDIQAHTNTCACTAVYPEQDVAKMWKSAESVLYTMNL